MIAAIMRDPRLAEVERLLTATGKSYRWLARAVGTNDQTVRRIVTNATRNPRDESIVERMLIALGEIPAVRERTTVYGRMLRPIPVAGTIMAGPPSMSDADIDIEEIPDWGGIFDRWGRRIDSDSMLEALRPADIPIFENSRAEIGNVVHAFRDGEDCVKAMIEDHGKLVLASFNPSGPRFPAEDWKVKGRCVARIRIGQFGTRHYTEFRGCLSWSMRHMTE